MRPLWIGCGCGWYRPLWITVGLLTSTWQTALVVLGGITSIITIIQRPGGLDDDAPADSVRSSAAVFNSCNRIPRPYVPLLPALLLVVIRLARWLMLVLVLVLWLLVVQLALLLLLLLCGGG